MILTLLIIALIACTCGILFCLVMACREHKKFERKMREFDERIEIGRRLGL